MIHDNTIKHTADFTLNDDGYYYSKTNTNIRFKIVVDEDPIWGGIYEDFRFEILIRPYFFRLIGKHKWDYTCQTNGFYEGLSFSNHLLFK